MIVVLIELASFAPMYTKQPKNYGRLTRVSKIAKVIIGIEPSKHHFKDKFIWKPGYNPVNMHLMLIMISKDWVMSIK